MSLEKVKKIAELQGWSAETRMVVFQAYRYGYDKLSDGFSHPLGWQYGARFFGFEKGPIGVGHDFLFYLTPVQASKLGLPTTLKTKDAWVLAAMKDGKVRRWRRLLAKWVLKVFSRFAHAKHRRKQRKLPGYGTLDYLKVKAG